MKDRFDIENEIMSIYSFSTNLRDISNAILEEELTVDETANVLEGVAVLLDIHAKKMYDTMCEAFSLNEWNGEQDV